MSNVAKKQLSDWVNFGVALHEIEPNGTTRYVDPLSKEGLEIQRKVAQLQLLKVQVDSAFRFYELKS